MARRQRPIGPPGRHAGQAPQPVDRGLDLPGIPPAPAADTRGAIRPPAAIRGTARSDQSGERIGEEQVGRIGYGHMVASTARAVDEASPPAEAPAEPAGEGSHRAGRAGALALVVAL